MVHHPNDLTLSFTSVNSLASQVLQLVKNTLATAGGTRDLGSMSGLGRVPEGGNGSPFQYSCPENSTDRKAWRATVLGS